MVWRLPYQLSYQECVINERDEIVKITIYFYICLSSLKLVPAPLGNKTGHGYFKVKIILIDSHEKEVLNNYLEQFIGAFERKYFGDKK